MAGIERSELVRGGEQRDVDEREADRAMDIVAEVAVLAFGDHSHPRARTAISRRRLGAHRQRFDEAVEPGRILQVPADPAVIQRLGAEIFAALGFLDAVVHRSEEHTSELKSLMRISYAVFCL